MPDDADLECVKEDRELLEILRKLFPDRELTRQQSKERVLLGMRLAKDSLLQAKKSLLDE